MFEIRPAGIFASLIVLSLFSLDAQAQTFVNKLFGVDVTSNLIYDSGNGLTLDVYAPAGGNVPDVKPGLVLVYGGAWVVGTKDAGPAENPFQAGDFDTPMKEYAAEFAKRGYVCAVINYRKFTDPGFGSYTGNGLLAGANVAPLTALLNILFSPSSVTEAQTRTELEVATEDTVSAINWLIANAGTYGVDSTRIAVGGWSSGGFNSLFATFAAGAPVAAVWANASTLGGGGNEALYITGSKKVPTIIFQGDNDTVVPYNPTLRDQLIAADIPHEYYIMSGEDHYFTRSQLVSDAPTRSVPDTVENLLADFMYNQMDLAAIPVAVPATSTLGLWLTLSALLAAAAVFGIHGAFRVYKR